MPPWRDVDFGRWTSRYDDDDDDDDDEVDENDEVLIRLEVIFGDTRRRHRRNNVSYIYRSKEREKEKRE